MTKWTEKVPQTGLASAPFLYMGLLSESCDYMDPAAIDHHANLIYNDLGAPAGVMGLVGDDIVAVRIVMDEKAVSKFGLRHESAKLHEVINDTAAAIRKQIGTSLTHTALGCINTPTPVAYFIFKGEEAAAEASLFYEQTQSFIEQQHSKPAPSR